MDINLTFLTPSQMFFPLYQRFVCLISSRQESYSRELVCRKGLLNSKQVLDSNITFPIKVCMSFGRGCFYLFGYLYL